MGKAWPARARRIAVISDIHANLPAFKAVLADIGKEGVDGIIHTGDVIGFGPNPAECLDLVLETPGLECVMGNHDLWCLNNDAGPGKPPGVVAHLEWTWKRVSPSHRKAMAEWAFRIEKDFGGLTALFQHYALDRTGRDFLPIERPPSADAYRTMFPPAGAVFFGHDHSASETSGQSFYANPGSLGTGPEPVARWILARFSPGSLEIGRRNAPYDRAPLWGDFEKLDVPGRTEVIARFYRTQSP